MRKENIVRVVVPAALFGTLGASVAFLIGAGMVLFSGSSSKQVGSWLLQGLGVGIFAGTLVGLTWVRLGGIAALCGAVGLIVGGLIAPPSGLPPGALFHWNAFGGLAIGVAAGIVTSVIHSRLPPATGGTLVPVGFILGGGITYAVSAAAALGQGADLRTASWPALSGVVGALAGGYLSAILEGWKAQKSGEGSGQRQ